MASPLPPSFLGIFIPPPECKLLFIVINFLVLWYIHLSSSHVYFNNDPEYLTSKTRYLSNAPHTREYGTWPFLMQHTPCEFQKCFETRRYSFQKERLWRQVINLALACVTWMPASQNPCQTASYDCHWNQDTPDLIRVPSHAADRSVFQPSVVQTGFWATSYDWDGPDVYLFDDISETEFRFEKLSGSSKVFCSYFLFHLHLFDNVRLYYSQVFVIFLFSKRSDSFWFGSSIPSVICLLLFIISTAHFSILNSIPLCRLSSSLWFFFSLLTNSLVSFFYINW